MNRGVLYALAAFGFWGLFPLYWKQLSFVPPEQQVGHRILWSFLLLLLAMPIGNRGREVLKALRTPRLCRIYLGSALLLGINWGVYLWAIKHDFIVEASLGYFINPLLNVLLGVVFLHERLRRWQWIAVGLAGVGVLYLTIVYGSLPWIGLTLAAAFGLYGLVRKIAPLGSINGLTLEMGILFVPTLAFMVFADTKGQGAFLHAGLRADLFMIGAGVVTTVPLLLFTAAARRIPLSLIGIIQYITPTGQFLLGVLLYNEPFTGDRAIGFTIIWIALAVFAVEGLVSQRRAKPCKANV
ncbi:EamA family transporter RarD [Planctomycetota bacterium]